MKIVVFVSVVAVMLTCNVCLGLGVNDLTIQQFLSTSENDVTLMNHKEMTAFIEKNSLNTPVFNKIEAITETSEFNLMRQRYGLKFYPRGFGESNCRKQILENQKTINRLVYDVKYKKAVKTRYDTILEYLKISQLIKNYAHTLNLYQNKRDALGVANKFKKLSVHLEVEDNINATMMALSELQNKKTAVISKIQMTSASKANVYFANESRASLDDLITVVEALAVKETVDNPELSLLQNKIDMLKHQYTLEKAKHNNYISYIQGDFDSDLAEDYDKAFSLKIAIKLPFIQSGNEAVNYLKIEHMNEKLAYLEAKRKHGESIKYYTQAFQRYKRQYSTLKQHMHKRLSLVTSEALSSEQTLDVNLSMALIEEKMIMMENKIWRVFINLVDASGQLSVKPLTNYITHPDVDESEPV